MKNTIVPYSQALATFDSLLDRWFDNSMFSFNTRMSVETNDKNDYVVSLPLPGFKQEEVQISLEEGILSIRADNKKYGSVQRSFTVGYGIDAEKVEAALKDGVLEILLPRTEEVKPKKIVVK